MKFNMGPLGPQIMAQVETKEMTDGPLPETKAAQALSEGAAEHKGKSSHKSKQEPQMACASTVMTMDIAKEMFLVGDVFMRKFYTIFDRDNNRVGLARARTGSSQATLSEQSKLNSQN